MITVFRGQDTRSEPQCLPLATSMTKSSKDTPNRAAPGGHADKAGALAGNGTGTPLKRKDHLGKATRLLDELALAATEPRGSAQIKRAHAIAQTVEDMGVDEEIVVGAMLYPLVEGSLLTKRAVAKQFGQEIAQIVRELIRLSSFGFPESWDPDKGLSPVQAEALRKMLLAIVADVRLVLVRLADQLHLLRSLKRSPVAERRRAAMETREIYAPLANRLGIWQLKWELEDLAFRYLDRSTYTKLAKALKERRADRERYIGSVTESLREELARAGIRAEVAGRPKHIYSIWRKMRRKDVELDHVFDVRALRVLVDSITDCYAALGIVHSKWTYIPGEFDDYIATPKENFYRSLHTAVIGPGKEPLEIQIRTHEMHRHAELGVAAHWRYKEGAAANPAFEQKISWLRQLLEPPEGEGGEGDFIDRVKSEIFEDRVYAVSPKGDVVDLPKGATPLDFAYHVHTEVGHHCRGAKVNGRIVPLTHQISNGEQVEIIASPHAKPSRDWLIPQLGYLASARSRSKVRGFFRLQDHDVNRKQGRALLDRELNRLGVKDYPVGDLVKALKLQTAEQLYGALGDGEITLGAVTTAIQRKLEPEERVPVSRRRRRRPTSTKSSISIEGIGDLMSQFARCCRPVPPEAIAGYITHGRGVSIHRQDCANMLRLAQQSPERVLVVDWSGGHGYTYPVDIVLHAYDRRGLVRDISTVLADEKISILSLTSRTYKTTNSVDMDLSIEIGGLDELSGILHRLAQLPNVVNVVRKT